MTQTSLGQTIKSRMSRCGPVHQNAGRAASMIPHVKVNPLVLTISEGVCWQRSREHNRPTLDPHQTHDAHAVHVIVAESKCLCMRMSKATAISLHQAFRHSVAMLAYPQSNASDIPSQQHNSKTCGYGITESWLEHLSEAHRANWNNDNP
jgi:hypothetical protein